METGGENEKLKERAAESKTDDMPAPAPKRVRLRSLDALRGFDMFWIVGGEGLFHRLAHVTQWPFLLWFSKELRHVPWEGFHFYDMIFPLFLFMAGVAIPYSIGRKMEAGTGRRKILLQILRRVALLVVLGVVYNGGLALRPLAQTRICSVLGLIGIGYGIAAIVFLYAKPEHRVRTMLAWVVGILLGYWAALAWIPVPGVGSGVFTPHGNLAGYLDRELLPWRLNDGFFDPEGLVQVFVAGSVGLMGALAGNLLRNVEMKSVRKALLLGGAGVVMVVTALVWGEVLPIIKKMWTPSFMLCAAGWSCLFLSIFYLIIDVAGCWRWSFFFIVIGMNPILIYLAHRIVPIENISGFFFGGLLAKFSEPSQAWLGALFYILTWWLALLYFYRKKCFLRV